MEPEIEEVLLKLNTKLKKEKINFDIAGSIALFLQGMNINPHDIDIITNKKGIKKIEKLFWRYKKQGIISEKEELKSSSYFCHFAMFKIDNVKVEILADTWAKNKKTKKIHKSNLKIKKFVGFKRQKIPVIPIEEELKAKEVIMWKPKRIAKIKKFLEKQRRLN